MDASTPKMMMRAMLRFPRFVMWSSEFQPSSICLWEMFFRHLTGFRLGAIVAYFLFTTYCLTKLFFLPSIE
jgi:hypothetical protein